MASRLRISLTLLLVIGCGSDGSGDGSSGASSLGMADSTAADGSTGPGPGPSTTGGDDATGGVPGTCAVFPADNPWNTDISGLAVHPDSDAIIASIGLDTNLHADFGAPYEGAPNGIPYIYVGADQPKVEIAFDVADESDPGPYPVPPDAPIEGGPDGDGDRHVLVVDEDACTLYELYYAYPVDGGASWTASSGAVFDLSSNALRPSGWTSADAAGLPIFPGLVRYDEVVERGAIDHALRFTVSQSRNAWIPPATHQASDLDDASLPPMGLRVRMKADYDCSGLASEIQVICAALKTYGMFVADNGSDWYISGAPDDRWNDDRLHDIDEITGAAFEVVYTGDPISG